MNNNGFKKIVNGLLCLSCSEILFEPIPLPCGSAVCKRCFTLATKRKSCDTQHTLGLSTVNSPLLSGNTCGALSAPLREHSLGPSDSVSLVSTCSTLGNQNMSIDNNNDEKEPVNDLEFAIVAVGAYNCPNRTCKRIHCARKETVHIYATNILKKLFPNQQKALEMVKNGEAELHKVRQMFENQNESSKPRGSDAQVGDVSVNKKSSSFCSTVKSLCPSKRPKSETKTRLAIENNEMEMKLLSDILLDFLSPSLELGPDIQLAYILRCKVLAQMSYFKESMLDAKKATELNPENMRGLCCEKYVSWLKSVECGGPCKVVEIAGNLRSGLSTLLSNIDKKPPSWVSLSNTLRDTLPNLSFDDLGCMLCLDTLGDPVTTPCGHSFCRNCLLNSIDQSKLCPLCRVPIPGIAYFVTLQSDKFLTSILENVFNVPCDGQVGGVAASIFASKWIPVMEGGLLYPGGTTQLHVSESKYRVLIKRVIENDGIFGLMLPPCCQSRVVIDHGVVVKIDNFEPLLSCDISETIDGKLPRYVVTCRVLYRFRAQEKKISDAGYSEILAERIEDMELDGSNWDPRVVEHNVCKARLAVKSLYSSLTTDARNNFEERHGTMPLDPSELSFWLAEFLPLNPYTLYELLPMVSIASRLELLCQWIEKAANNAIRQKITRVADLSHPCTEDVEMAE